MVLNKVLLIGQTAQYNNSINHSHVDTVYITIFNNINKYNIYIIPLKLTF